VKQPEMTLTPCFARTTQVSTSPLFFLSVPPPVLPFLDTTSPTPYTMLPIPPGTPPRTTNRYRNSTSVSPYRRPKRTSSGDHVPMDASTRWVVGVDIADGGELEVEFCLAWGVEVSVKYNIEQGYAGEEHAEGLAALFEGEIKREVEEGLKKPETNDGSFPFLQHS
jgi:hypothetical protein